MRLHHCFFLHSHASFFATVAYTGEADKSVPQIWDSKSCQRSAITQDPEGSPCSTHTGSDILWVYSPLQLQAACWGRLAVTAVHCVTQGCTAGPHLTDTPSPHHGQVLTLLKNAVTRGEQTLQPVRYAPHGKSYIPHARYTHLPPQNKLRYKVSRYLCSDFPRDNGFPNKLDAALHLFSIGEKGETINLETNQEWARTQKKMKSEGEQGRLIIKAYPFEASFTYILFPLAAAILQSFIKIASLQRNYLKQRSDRFFRTNENKPPRKKSSFLFQTGVLSFPSHLHPSQGWDGSNHSRGLWWCCQLSWECTGQPTKQLNGWTTLANALQHQTKRQQISSLSGCAGKVPWWWLCVVGFGQHLSNLNKRRSRRRCGLHRQLAACGNKTEQMQPLYAVDHISWQAEIFELQIYGFPQLLLLLSFFLMEVSIFKRF